MSTPTAMPKAAPSDTFFELAYTHIHQNTEAQ